MRNDWEKVNLSELGELSRGKSKHRPRNDSKLYGGKYPFIQTADVKSANFYINEFSQTYNEEGLKQSKLWEKGTLCITIAANIAESAILSFPACFPDSIVGFLPYDGVSDVRYVKYLLDNYKAEFQKRSKGATQDNLSVSKINSLKLSVPDYPYQVKVAEIISTYDTLIENNQKRIKYLEKMAQRLYTEWFVKFKFPGHEDVKMVDSGTEFGMVPEGWEVKMIGDIVRLQNGYPFKPSHHFEEGLPIIKIPELRLGILERTPRNDGLDIDRKYHVKDGDILFSWSATLLVNTWHSGAALLNQHLFKVTPKLENLDMFTYLLIDSLIYKLKAHTVGSTMKHLRKGTIESSKLVLPDPAILREFDAITRTLLDLRIATHQNISVLKNLRDQLIENLITGKRLLKE